MSMNQPDVERFQRTVAKSLHEHWVLFLVEGIVLVILGMAAIAIPPLAVFTFTFLIGFLLLVSGIAGLVSTFGMLHAPGFWWSLLSAALAILAGLVLLAQPVIGAVSLTLLLVTFFLIEGVVSIMFALDHKRELSGQWQWMLLSGIVDLILGGMIFAGLPATAAWAIGLLVGINLVFGGVALISMALHARNAAPAG